jgi:hypothetical protein
LDRRLGGPQSRSGRDGEEKNSQAWYIDGWIILYGYYRNLFSKFDFLRIGSMVIRVMNVYNFITAGNLFTS